MLARRIRFILSSATAIVTSVIVLAVTPAAAELQQTPSTPSSGNTSSAKPVVDTQLQLIEVFTDTGQALIFNQRAREYDLVRVGVRVRGWEIAAIGKRHIELESRRGQNVRLVQAGRTLKPASSQPTADQPRDPYEASATEVNSDKHLLDPYGPEVKAPVAEPPSKVKVVRAPAGSRAPVTPGKTILDAEELDKALGDLEKVSRVIELRATADGFKVTSIGKGSLPYRVGLRRGDVIRRVAGVRTTELEDGADVFLKLSQARSFAIEISRDGVNASFDVVIKGR